MDAMSGSRMGQMRESPRETEAGETDGGVEFCIRLAADGALTYYTERDGQPESEQPANDIGQALKFVLEAYRSISSGGAERDGYDSVADPLARGPAPPRKARFGGQQ